MRETELIVFNLLVTVSVISFGAMSALIAAMIWAL